MTFTGLTPLLDSLIANNNIIAFVPYLNGTTYSSIGNWAATPTSTVRLNRGGASVSAVSGSIYYQYTGLNAALTNEMSIVAVIVPRTSGDYIVNNSKLELSCHGTAMAFRFTSSTSTFAVSAKNSLVLGKRTCIIVTRTNANPSLGNIYIDGALSGAANQSTGTITAGTVEMRLAQSVGSTQLVMFVNRVITAPEAVTLTDELDNQIRYEQQSMIVNGSYSAGQDVWRACFGILAGEVTMSAGQSLGQLDALRVASGTHKATTFLYNGVLAKGIKCVTAGNIILPDPRPTLGTTWAYRYYDDSAGTWATRTSASSTVALDAVNDIILWSTADGQTALRKY
jgi:hypothetical protein